MMGGIIIAAALAASAGYFFVRQFTKEPPRPHLPSYDLTPWGEVVYLHPEMRRARKGSGGTASEQGGRADTSDSIARRHGEANR